MTLYFKLPPPNTPSSKPVIFGFAPCLSKQHLHHVNKALLWGLLVSTSHPSLDCEAQRAGIVFILFTQHKPTTWLLFYRCKSETQFSPKKSHLVTLKPLSLARVRPRVSRFPNQAVGWNSTFFLPWKAVVCMRPWAGPCSLGCWAFDWSL